MKSLGVVIRKLLSKRGYTSKELSRRVNLSETSVSKIVQGLTKPRQGNLTRIIQELCRTPEEEQQIISAYARIENDFEDEQAQRNQAIFDKIEVERVRRYLRAKSQSIAFREQVAATLNKAGIAYESPYSNSDIISDFLIPGPPRIAIECKANPNRDWDRTETAAQLFLSELPCDYVIVTVPDSDQVPERRVSEIDVVHINELTRSLIQLQK